jgi:16S rRNA (uracil1498-N3)-methyltransferase
MFSVRTSRSAQCRHRANAASATPNAAAPGSLAGLTSLPNKVELLIGPEGGLDDDELLAAQKAGFMPVRLGPRVLRTETAAVVALTVLQALWGDLR